MTNKDIELDSITKLGTNWSISTLLKSAASFKN